MRYAICLLLFLLTPDAGADEHRDRVERALANVSDDYHATWAYTETTISEGETFVGHYDPSRPDGERWQLLSVDGREPTRDEVEDFVEDRADGVDDEDSDGEVSIVDIDSLELIEETDQFWRYRFTPNSGDDDEAKFLQDVNASVRIQRDGEYPDLIELRNEKPIRPVIGVRISEFLTRLTFGPANGVGPVVPLTMDTTVRGRAGLIIGFDERESVRYTDYTPVSVPNR